MDVVDLRDRPLMVMNLYDVHQQQLPHRSVLIILLDRQGRAYLQRRSPEKRLYPGRWDVSASGHVKAGESREAAALRELREELSVRLDELRLWRTIPASKDNGFEFLTLFHAGRREVAPIPNPAEVVEGMFVDRDELGYMVSEFRETLTPGLVYFWEKNLIFPE